MIFRDAKINCRKDTAWKVSVFVVLLVLIFRTSYLSVFSPNARKYEPGKFRKGAQKIFDWITSRFWVHLRPSVHFLSLFLSMLFFLTRVMYFLNSQYNNKQEQRQGRRPDHHRQEKWKRKRRKKESQG